MPFGHVRPFIMYDSHGLYKEVLVDGTMCNFKITQENRPFFRDKRKIKILLLLKHHQHDLSLKSTDES